MGQQLLFCSRAASAAPYLPYTRTMPLRSISLNVKGISNFKKRRTIFTWCRKHNADITFLQETHSTLQTMLQWKIEWGAKLITSHGSSYSRGVAIMIKNNLDCTIHHTVLDPMGQ